MRLHQSHSKSVSISFVISLFTLLRSHYQLRELYQPTKENIKDLQEHIANAFDEIHLSDRGELIPTPENHILRHMICPQVIRLSNDTALLVDPSFS